MTSLSSNPHIAVLLPSYNPGPDLLDTLDSLRTQTVPFQLFLVDDGSKEHTDYETLCKGIDARIVRLPKNLGITGAMNAGLSEILAGDYNYVARIDAGDRCTADRFKKQVDWLTSHPDIDILGSAIELNVFDDQGEATSKRMVRYPLTPDLCRKQLSYNIACIHPAMMIRRKVFEALKGYSENYPAAEDFELMWRASRAGFNLANLDDVLLIKDENPGSISQKRRRRQITSRLRIQWANRNLASPRCWLGLARSIVTLVAPAAVIMTAKQALSRLKA